MLNDEWRMRARLRFSNIDGAAEYPGYDGRRHEASVRFNRDSDEWRLGFAYSFELSDYDAARLSAMRHLLLADARHPLTNEWSVRSSVSYRYSDYDADRGTENRIEWSVGAERTLTARWNLTVEYMFTDNMASDAFYDYSRNRLYAGVEALF